MNWRKSSYSAANGDCVEVASWRTSSYSYTQECVEVASWRKSSYSTESACVEVGAGQSVVAVRDTKADGAGPVLAFTPQAWAAFTASLRA